jgi:hypothetical protein
MAMLCSLGDCNSTACVLFFYFLLGYFVYYIIGTTTDLCIAVYIDLFGLIFQFALVHLCHYLSFLKEVMSQ